MPRQHRTIVLHTYEAYLDKYGEQLELDLGLPPDLPDPGRYTERFWFYVLYGVAFSDGTIKMGQDVACRRYALTAVQFRRLNRALIRQGWLVNVGKAYRRHAQDRRLVVPPWAEPLAKASTSASTETPAPSPNGGSPMTPQTSEWGVTQDTPITEWGVTQDPNGGSPMTPPLVVRDKKSKGGGGVAPKSAATPPPPPDNPARLQALEQQAPEPRSSPAPQAPAPPARQADAPDAANEALQREFERDVHLAAAANPALRVDCPGCRAPAGRTCRGRFIGVYCPERTAHLVNT